MKILILMNSVPFPVRKNGVSIRYFPLIRELVALGHQINLVILPRLVCSPNDEHKRKIEELGVNVMVCDNREDAKNDSSRMARKLITFLQQYPTPTDEISIGLKNKSQILRDILVDRFDLGIAVGSDNFKIMNSLPIKSRPNRIILDFIDSPSLHYSRRSLPKNTRLKSRIIHKMNNHLYSQWERDIGTQADKVAYISHADAEFCDMHRASINSIVIPNGIEINDYSASRSIDSIKRPAFGFVGNMAYEPNQIAVDWLIKHAWPRIIDKLPSAKLYIIGRNPSLALNDKVANVKSITITGTVENIWEYYNSLDVFLCPLQNGAGLQNKILEAMYAKVPVVASTIANSGLNATKKQIVLADSPQLFSDEALGLIADTARASELGAAAYEFVSKKFSWPNIVESLLNDL